MPTTGALPMNHLVQSKRHVTFIDEYPVWHSTLICRLWYRGKFNTPPNWYRSLQSSQCNAIFSCPYRCGANDIGVGIYAWLRCL